MFTRIEHAPVTGRLFVSSMEMGTESSEYSHIRIPRPSSFDRLIDPLGTHSPDGCD